MATVLGNVLDFFRNLGVFDVLLPFILTFTIVFAILEKTRVLGLEGSGDKAVTKKNLNAMTAFVIAFFVVASSKLVSIVVKVSSELVIVLLSLVFFLMLVGSFYTKTDIEAQKYFDNNWWKYGFMIYVALCIIFIFMDAIKTNSGKTWLEVFWDWISSYASNTGVAAILLIIAVIAIVAYVTRDTKETK